MNGVVLLGPASGERVLGLPVAQRAALALQAAGAARVLFVGADAAAHARAFDADDRRRVPCEAAEGWPAGGALVVGAEAVLDARAARALAAGAPGDGLAAAGGWLAARTDAPGRTLEDAGPSRALAGAGVARLARGPEGRRDATRALLDSLRKPQDGWVSRALNRRISLAVTRVLAATPLRPNQLSVAILFVGLLGGYLAARGTTAALAWGGVLFQAQSVLDGCDGELSRLSFRGSRLGEWLDTIGDDATNYAFFGGAALGLHVAGLGALPLVFGGVGLAAGLAASGIEYRYLVRIGSGDLLKYPLGFGHDPEPVAAPSLGARVLGALRPAFKRDFFALLTMVAALAGRGPTLAMLGLFAAGACATLGAVVASEVRRARGGGR